MTGFERELLKQLSRVAEALERSQKLPLPPRAIPPKDAPPTGEYEFDTAVRPFIPRTR